VPVGHLTPGRNRGQPVSARPVPGSASLPVQGRGADRIRADRTVIIMTMQVCYHRSHRCRAAGQAGARLGRLATVLVAVIAGLLASAAAANPVPVGTGAPSPSTRPRPRPSG